MSSHDLRQSAMNRIHPAKRAPRQLLLDCRPLVSYMEVNTFWFGPANAHWTCLAEDTFPPLFPDAMPTSRY